MPGKTSDVRADKDVKIKLKIDGKVKEGTKCDVVFWRDKEDNSREEIEKQADLAIPANKTIELTWTAKGLKAGELSCLVHFEAQLQGKKKGAGTEYLSLRVWASSFKIKIKNADDSDKPFIGALFRVRQGDTKTKLLPYRLAKPSDDAMELELTVFEEPQLEMFNPYELAAGAFTLANGVYEARARKKPFKAAFKQIPEVTQNTPADGKYTRKQYVNLETGPNRNLKPNEGHLIKLEVGTNEPITLATDVYVEVTFSGAVNGTRSKRNDPEPKLVWGADKDGTKTTFTGKATFRPDRNASFTIELGLAGGDVCTIKIGSTASCSDATLEITNWRRLGYHMFRPDATLSDSAKFSDQDTKGYSDTVLEKIRKELAKCYIEYEAAADVKTFDASVLPDKLKYCSVDGAHMGKDKGKKVFCIEEDPLKELGLKLKPAAIQGNEHTIVLADFITEKQPRTTISVKMTSAEAAVTLHESDKAVFPVDRSGLYPGISSLVLTVTKLNGKEIDTTTKSDKSHQLYQYFLGKKIWDLNDKYDAIKATYAQFITFLSHTKVKITLPSTAVTDPGKIFTSFSVEMTATLQYELRDKESCLGMAYGSTGGLMVLPVLHKGVKDDTLHTTIVHELSHVLDQAYGDPADMKAFPPKKAIPGMPYRKCVNKGGNAYDGRGHQGGHCAIGLGDTDKQETDFTCDISIRGAKMALKPTCINFGSDNLRALTLCEECSEILRAQDLRDLPALS